VGVRELDPGQLGRLDRFNGGGQATIYRAPDLSLPGESGPFVYKAYNDRTIHGKREAMRNSLRSLIRVRSEAADEDRRVIDARCVWPLAVVADGRGATGCIMREVPDVFFRRITYSTGRVRLKPWSWEFHLQDPQEVADRGLPNLKDADVAFLLARALRFLATVHRLDVIVGDLSSANILISTVSGTPKKSRPMFVDVDTYRIQRAVSALEQRHTPEWWTPESRQNLARWKELERRGAAHHEIATAKARTRIQDKPSDVYKAGLLVLRTLDAGPSSLRLSRSSAASARLTRLFGTTRAAVLLSSLEPEPHDRPSAEAMAHALSGGIG
jgi:hypothetical protein